MRRSLLERWREWRDQPEPGSSAEDKAQLIEKIAAAVADRGLETPAVLFLESYRPLGFIASQGAVMASPLVWALAPGVEMEALAALLDDREAIEQLIARIEELAAARHSRPREG